MDETCNRFYRLEEIYGVGKICYNQRCQFTQYRGNSKTLPAMAENRGFARRILCENRKTDSLAHEFVPHQDKSNA